MDFYKIKERTLPSGKIELSPDFRVVRSHDMMVRGSKFYAVWDKAKELWSTDEYELRRLVDEDLFARKEEIEKTTPGAKVVVKSMQEFSSGRWTEFKTYLSKLADSSHQIDEKLTFTNTPTSKSDYVSKRLPYSLAEGDHSAYTELSTTLYEPKELEKLEWGIGAVISGDSKKIEKFIVLYGEGGSGKTTYLNIVQKLFEGYYSAFDAKAITSNNNSFALEILKNNPLVAIDHDGDLSRIETNTMFNSLVGHDNMNMNEKYKTPYMMSFNCFLFMGTNSPVKITNAKSGLIRRLIDVRPSGRKVPVKQYYDLVARIDFELGAIAWHCLEVYKKLGKNYYALYKPVDMMFETNIFFNYVESYFEQFQTQDGATLTQAYDWYKQYCSESKIDRIEPKYKFREELRSYFVKLHDVTRVEGKQVRNYYQGFRADKFSTEQELVGKEENESWIVLEEGPSLFDEMCGICLAQYANDAGTPEKRWIDVKTQLWDLDTTQLHYVQLPEPGETTHIVIDFDMKDEKGYKSVVRVLEAASSWPPTYAELSKSGEGLHLHYFYTGDASRLSNLYSPGIEIKVFNGDAALRRKLSKCNKLAVATLNGGLPLKEEKVINDKVVRSEMGLRNLIEKNLAKEIHPGTRPSIDFIYTILEEATKSGMHYDVSDMRGRILSFAMRSTNQKEYCVRRVTQMKFASVEPSVDKGFQEEDRVVFYDVECFSNMFLVCWKYEGDDQMVNLLNPTPQEIEHLLKLKTVGFNNRRYDNHMLYACYLGYSIEDLYRLSQKIISNNRSCLFGEAYNVSYLDVYDVATKKQSLKKWQIELGIHHQELGHPWNLPVPEELIPLVIEYCGNDVRSLEVVYHHIKEDVVARKILSELSGLSMNETTQRHAAKIIFGNDNHPQDKFIYPDLSKLFPGYTFEHGKSLYRGENPGEGGYVYAEHGVYKNVALLDIASMHPSSIILMGLFGPYTKNYSDLKDARIAIKHKDYDSAKGMLGGVLEKYLVDKEASGNLANALKIALNIVYGLTSAAFNNPFKDPRNNDNVVAKRGALFMINLKHEVQARGFTVAHIKTDSIKIPDATQEIVDFVFAYGKQYGYDFEHEATYAKMFLANDAVYIAKYDDKGIRTKGGKHANEWTSTGAQYSHPYVFKNMFSKEPVLFEDMCETKAAVDADFYLDQLDEKGELFNSTYVGRTGQFCPMEKEYGMTLMRVSDGKRHAVVGTKGYYWLESEVVKKLGLEDHIDKQYYRHLVDAAVANLTAYNVDVESFVD